MTDHAQRIARMLPGELGAAAAPPSRVRDVIAPEVTLERLQMVAVYRVQRVTDGAPHVVPVIDVASPTLPPGNSRASADRLAERVVSSGADQRALEPLPGGGELMRAAAPVRSADGRTVGVVVATDLLSGDLAERSRRMTRAYEDYMQLRVLKQPLTGAYLSFFLMLTLMIMVGATWMGLYLAKRITRPVQMLSAAAREIGAGHLDRRLEPETADEFGSLVDAFNSMAGELAASRQKLEQSTHDLQRKHVEVEGRRRYIETVLERIATGVISVDAAGLVTTINASAARLLGIDSDAAGRPVHDVLARSDLVPLLDLLQKVLRGRAEPPAQEIALMRQEREVHLAAVASALHGESGAEEGAVLVFDDVTPLIRSQKVAAWREVARRLAHEIKNPLTPIQLSAERLRRHFGSAPPATQALVAECTSTIVAEVDSLKGLVDEFSQFARMPAPRTVPTRSPPAARGDADALRRALQPVAVRAALRSGAAARADRCRSNQARGREPRGQRHRGHEPEGNRHHRNAARSAEQPGAARAFGQRPGHPCRPTATSCSCRTTPPSSAAAGSVSPSSGASSPSMAARIEVGENTPTGARFTIELPC